MNKKARTFLKYFREYQWSNIFAMIRNGSRDPEICTDTSKDKLVVITGATSGIGYLAARKYASMGADLLCITRNREKSERLKNEFEQEFGVSCNYTLGDLGLLEDIRRIAQELSKLDRSIDVLIFNAGIYLTKQELTQDGIDRVLAVHHLSYFIMTHALIPKMRSQERARIILVNSEGHRFAAWGLHVDDLNWDRHKYTGLKSYGSAKLAQLQSMLVFDEQLRGSGVTINAMHPGAVKTETGQENGRLYKWYKRNVLDKMLKSPEVSGEALYYLGVSKDVAGMSGKFFNLTTLEVPAPPALDREAARELWEQSLRLAGIENNDEKQTTESGDLDKGKT